MRRPFVNYHFILHLFYHFPQLFLFVCFPVKFVKFTFISTRFDENVDVGIAWNGDVFGSESQHNGINSLHPPTGRKKGKSGTLEIILPQARIKELKKKKK